MIWIILIIGFLIRLVNLNQSFWLDEAITALALKTNSPLELITKFSPGDFHPPLYYILLKAWSNIFGYSEISLRLPSIFFCLATVMFIFFIGKKMFGSKSGLIAAFILSVNPLAVYYSQEARMYTMAMMFVAGSVWFLLEKKWLLFIVFATASIYTDYLPGLMFPVYFLMLKNKKILLIPILLFLPWLSNFLFQLQTGLSLTSEIPAWGAALGGFSLKALGLTFVKFIFGRISLENKILYALLVTLGCSGYFLIMVRNKNKIPWLWLSIPVLTGLILSLRVSIFTYFRFLFTLPALPLLLTGQTNSRKSIVFITLVSLSSLFYFNSQSRFWREDWRNAAQYMKTENSLAIMPSLAQSAPLTYYNLETPLIDISKPIVLGKAKTIYLIRYVPEIFDPQDIALKKIETSKYKFKENKNFNGVVIWKYEKI